MVSEVQNTGIAATLGLDYKLFLAQLINFGLILIVIWRFVYRPLVKTLDERSKKIEQGLHDAEAAGEKLATAGSEQKKIVSDARLKSKEIIELAEQTATKRRDELIAVARAEVERVVLEGKQKLRDEQAVMMDAARREIAEVVLLAAEKVLGEKVDSKKDAALIQSVLKDLKK